VYVIKEVPGETAETNPVDELIVATLGVALVHTPPVVVLANWEVAE